MKDFLSNKIQLEAEIRDLLQDFIKNNPDLPPDNVGISIEVDFHQHYDDIIIDDVDVDITL